MGCYKIKYFFYETLSDIYCIPQDVFFYLVFLLLHLSAFVPSNTTKVKRIKLMNRLKEFIGNDSESLRLMVQIISQEIRGS